MSGRIRLFWLILAVLFAAAAGFACFYAGLFGSILIQPDGDPAETVTRFFTSLQNRDYDAAYACLNDYATLGLEKEPETAEAQRVYDAIRNSYARDGAAEKMHMHIVPGMMHCYASAPVFKESRRDFGQQIALLRQI